VHSRYNPKTKQVVYAWVVCCERANISKIHVRFLGWVLL
jgi:hypothetical protein